MPKAGFDPERPESCPSSLSETQFAEAFPRESQVVEFKQGLSRTAVTPVISPFEAARGGA